MSEETKDQKADEKKEPKKLTEEEPVVNSCSAAGIKYDLETGRLPIFDNEGEIDGLIFYHYYKRTDVKGDRPLIVSFNGGPGVRACGFTWCAWPEACEDATPR
ncbi:MAG: hypothetical protein R2688_00885 [Fimbriimonadaceae bacterium]